MTSYTDQNNVTCYKLKVLEYTPLNVLVLELKVHVYCGPDKFYGRSKFGQYDKDKNRSPSNKDQQLKKMYVEWNIS